MGGAVPQQRPVSTRLLSNRTCGFPAYGLPVKILVQHARLRVLHRPAKTGQALLLKPRSPPLARFSRLQPPAFPTHHESSQAFHHVLVDAEEFLRRIACAEVRPPAPQHRVEVL